MNVVKNHFRSMLAGGTLALILVAASSARADQPQQAVGGSQAPLTIASTHQESGPGEREEGSDTDGRRWYRFRYHYHSYYYYSPVYYYYYTPVVVWRWAPVVVRYDGTGAAKDGQTSSSPEKVSDGVAKSGGF